MRRDDRGALARGWLRLTGRPFRNPLSAMISRDKRYDMFQDAVDYVDFEKVEGDILEFGVFAGMSLALFADICRRRWVESPALPRRVAGFDSFAGLGETAHPHPRWEKGACLVNRGAHPFLPRGARMTAAAAFRLFKLCRLPAPEIEAGEFAEVLPRVIGSKYKRAAVVHIDCDLYEAARSALFQLEPILQEGTVILFDDWFHYRADPAQGEARAFREFLDEHPAWVSVPYRVYGTFSNSFILRRSPPSAVTKNRAILL